MVDSAYRSSLENSSVFFIFCSNDMLLYSIFCVGSAARTFCSTELSDFLLLFLCPVFLGRSTWNSNFNCAAGRREHFRAYEYR